MKKHLAWVLAVLFVSCSQPTPPTKEKFPCPAWRVSEKPADRAYSVVDGARVRLMPSKISFVLPEKWVAPNARVGERDLRACSYLSAEELETVATAVRPGWKHYVTICNAIFPFDRCAISAGSTPWDVPTEFAHVRVYDLDENLADVVNRIEKKGKEEILRATRKAPSVILSKHGEWNRIEFSYDWWDDDLHVRDYFDCYARTCGNRIIVFCFTGYFECERILKSVNCSPPK